MLANLNALSRLRPRLQRLGAPLLGLATCTALTLIWLPASEAASTGSLSVHLSGFKSTQGNVCLQVFNSSRGFPGDQSKALAGRCVKVSGQAMNVSFGQLPTGTYAVAVLHDINGDRQMNRNGLGIPTEGYGFSRNPVIRTGPPRFGDSAVLVAGPNTKIDIQVRYFGR
jgi:uncharacterized protein (DUF2141 family)